MATTYATSKLRPGPQGNAALVLDGAKCGLIGNLSGGSIFAEVVEEQMGPAYLTKKHLGPLRYEDFSLEIGFAMARPVFDWVAASWRMNHQRKNGSIIACDEKLEAKSERKFFNALITETTIPTLDAASKEPVWLTLKLAPESIQQVKASGKTSGSDPKHPEKILLPANFKLEIDELDCTKVSRIESFTVKQSVTHDEIGDARDRLVEPGRLSFPNLKVTFAEVAEHSWLDWFEDFVVKGNGGDDKEKSGKLTLLSPNKQVLATIKFLNLGIFRIGHANAAAGQDRVKLATAELYCERMEFEPGS